MDTIKSKQRPARILLVEDNHGDVILTRRAFKDAKIPNELSVASTGEEALVMLKQGETPQRPPLPDLILLDLNLPKMSGLEVLQTIKSTPELKRIPVIVLSSSHAEQDVVKSYDLHSNAYIVKPGNLESFHAAIEKLEQFWFTLVLSSERVAE